MNISIVGTGYVGLSNAVLLAQHNKVIALDIDQKKVQLINSKKSPIDDKEIISFLANEDLQIHATVDKIEAYQNAELIIIATSTDYDTEKDYFDTSSIESVLDDVFSIRDKSVNIVIKSTIPLGYTKYLRKKYNSKNIIFSPEFLREGKALFDNLFP